jgi:hypothetical protein
MNPSIMPLGKFQGYIDEKRKLFAENNIKAPSIFTHMENFIDYCHGYLQNKVKNFHSKLLVTVEGPENPLRDEYVFNISIFPAALEQDQQHLSELLKNFRVFEKKYKGMSSASFFFHNNTLRIGNGNDPVE